MTDSRGITVVDMFERIEVERFAVGRAADYRLELPLAKLAPGPHLLPMAVTANSITAQRHVRFDVRPPLRIEPLR